MGLLEEDGAIFVDEGIVGPVPDGLVIILYGRPIVERPTDRGAGLECTSPLRSAQVGHGQDPLEYAQRLQISLSVGCQTTIIIVHSYNLDQIVHALGDI